MPDTLPILTLNTPGARGLDLRSGVGDADALACRDLLNMDIWPGLGAQGTRVLPRRPFKHWMRRHLAINAVLAAGAGFTGIYWYRYRFTDAAGVVHISTVAAAGSAGAYLNNTISGWASAAGSVSIYRTHDGDPSTATYFLVTTLNPAITASYADTTADGSLGAAMPADPSYADPIGNQSFNQTALVDYMLLHLSQSENQRLVTIRARTDGLAGGSRAYLGKPDLAAIPPAAYGALIETVAGTGYPDYPCSAALLGNLLWEANGKNTLAYRDTNSAGGFTAATQTSQPSISSGSQASGALSAVTGHSYVVVMKVIATGIRSLPSAPRLFAGPYSSKKNTINFSTVPSGQKGEIYRTSDGGQFFQFLAEVAAGGSSYADEAQDTTLSQELVSFAVGQPDGARYVCAHKGLLFEWNLLDTDGNVFGSRVRWSSEKPFNFPDDPFVASDYQRDVDADDGDQGTGMYSWGELLILFKRRRIYQLTGDPPTGFRWAPVPGSEGFGCLAFRTIRQTSVGLMWLSPAGVCLMTQPGAAPILISAAVREALIEPGRSGTLEPAGGATSTQRPAVGFDYSAAAAGNLDFQAQLSTSSNFAAIAFDYQTTDSAERDYFTLGNGPFPGSGAAVVAGRRLRLAITPPPPSGGGPAAGTAYFVRYRVSSDAGANWSGWTVLAGTFTVPADDNLLGQINWQRIVWAHAAHYGPRQEYWLWLPLGSNVHCELCLVCQYAALAEGGDSSMVLWRRMNAPASCSAYWESLQINSGSPQDYLVIAHPDGLLQFAPWLGDVFDFDAGLPLSAAQRRFSGTLSGATLTFASAGWPLAGAANGYALAGSVLAARDAAGRVFTGLITANTATTLTVVWTEGRSPAAGSLVCVIGGIDAHLFSAWLALADAPEHSVIVREAVLHSGAGRARVRLQIQSAAAPREDPRGLRSANFDVPVGSDFQASRVRVDRRGHYHSVGIGTLDVPALWEIRQAGLTVEQTGSRL